MAKDDMVDADLPSRDAAKEFYAKYEPKEALGRWGEVFYIPLPLSFLIIVSCRTVIKTTMHSENKWAINECFKLKINSYKNSIFIN